MSPEAIEKIVTAVIIGVQAGLSGWHLRTNAKNRRQGRVRDTLITSSADRTEAAVGRLETKLDGIARDGWENGTRIRVLEARTDALEKDVGHLREDIRR